jgi:hypothetical protein
MVSYFDFVSFGSQHYAYAVTRKAKRDEDKPIISRKETPAERHTVFREEILATYHSKTQE